MRAADSGPHNIRANPLLFLPAALVY